MRFTVDLDTCADQGQCVLSAPAVFTLGEDGSLAFRQQATSVYVSGELDESLRPEIEDAVGSCPMQAIAIED